MPVDGAGYWLGRDGLCELYIVGHRLIDQPIHLAMQLHQTGWRRLPGLPGHQDACYKTA
jgi:hypothetical protein